MLKNYYLHEVNKCKGKKIIFKCDGKAWFGVELR